VANNGWTPERRARQAALIRRLKPWMKATGPKSVQGTTKSKMNALKHGGRSTSIRRLSRVLRLIETFESPQGGEKK
jgi:hypothetical protein